MIKEKIEKHSAKFAILVLNELIIFSYHSCIPIEIVKISLFHNSPLDNLNGNSASVPILMYSGTGYT